MSRIEDKEMDRRAEARRADKVAQEQQKKARTEQVSAFDRALAQKAGEQAPARSFADAQRLKQDKAQAESKPQTTLQAKAGEKADAGEKAAKEAPVERGADQKQAERQGPMSRNPGLAGGARQAPMLAGQEARQSALGRDAQASSEKTTESRGEDVRGDTPGRGVGKKGDPLRRISDDDRGAGSGGGRDQGGGSSSKEQTPNAFRLPPAALMAPPPLARPKDANSARLSQITKEIVDKIVSRVMVGQNAQGTSEFRIELKSSVLKGLSIKVSGGRGGKIRAVFSGSDREVLQALKKSSGELVQALSSRGLTVEDLQFEERDR